MGLPGLPTTKARIIGRASSERWYSEERKGLGGTRRIYAIPEKYLLPEQHQRSKEDDDLQRAKERVLEVRRAGRIDDDALLRAVILTVERWSKKKGIHSPDPEKKAALISLLFRYFQAEGKLDDEKILEFLKAVA
jgi:hypothetical protein